MVLNYFLVGCPCILEKTKIVEDRESLLDDVFAKAIPQVVEMKSDVYVNFPTGYG